MSTNSRLTDEQIDELAERLRRGEYLEEYLRPLLFRQAKEYELAYRDKAPRSRVVSEAMGVPWQTLKRFGHAGEDDRVNHLVVGDNLQVLKTLLEMKNRGELKNADGSTVSASATSIRRSPPSRSSGFTAGSEPTATRSRGPSSSSSCASGSSSSASY